MKKSSFLSKKEKRKELVGALKEFASTKQKNVMAFLRDAQKKGKVNKIANLWSLNTIAFSADPDVIKTLADNFREIKEIRYDGRLNKKLDKSEKSLSLNKTMSFDDYTIDPGLTIMNVEEVWEAGYKGQGILVASIDEGFGWGHPDLVNHIWNNLGEDADGDGHTIEWDGSKWVYDPGDINGIDDDGNGYVDDFIGWNCENENNTFDHGSLSAGIIVGDGTLGIKTGVVPEAKVIFIQVGDNDHTLQTYMWEAMQYAIDRGVDVITASQSYHFELVDDLDISMFRDLAVLELQAGIIHFTSSSNNGDHVDVLPPPYNISTPGNCPPPWLSPAQTLRGGLSSIISVGNVYADGDYIVESSPYGPSAWQDYSGSPYNVHPVPECYRDYPYEPGSSTNIGLLKPDLSAPGQNTISTNAGIGGTWGYAWAGGTSHATPHAAGVAALILSINPDLTPSQVCEIMETSAVDKGAPGHDDRYGAGRIDAYSAYLLTVSAFPVELNSFTTKLVGNNVELTWRTETEINNYGFEIQRSTDKISWSRIGFVTGQGNCNSPHNYSFVDNSIPVGTIYYRLKQEDIDGKFKYSDVIELNNESSSEIELSQNFPNPFNPATTIKFQIPEKTRVTLKIIDALGREVKTLVDGEAAAGIHKISFDGSSLSSGIYICQLTANGKFHTKKMILLK